MRAHYALELLASTLLIIGGCSSDGSEVPQQNSQAAERAEAAFNDLYESALAVQEDTLQTSAETCALTYGHLPSDLPPEISDEAYMLEITVWFKDRALAAASAGVTESGYVRPPLEDMPYGTPEKTLQVFRDGGTRDSDVWSEHLEVAVTLWNLRLKRHEYKRAVVAALQKDLARYAEAVASESSEERLQRKKSLFWELVH